MLVTDMIKISLVNLIKKMIGQRQHNFYFHTLHEVVHYCNYIICYLNLHICFGGRPNTICIYAYEFPTIYNKAICIC